MEAIVLDLAKAQFLVDQAIKQKGEDYVYPRAGGGSCVYVDTVIEHGPEYGEIREVPTCPSCLVGYALVKAGVDQEWFLEREINDGSASEVLGALRDDGIIMRDDEVEEYFSTVQRNQDAGVPWGEADKRARKGEYFVGRYRSNNGKWWDSNGPIMK